ncbi:MAG: tetratricopeptide repeat protein, partial [Candidatus Binatia bacterium]
FGFRQGIDEEVAETALVDGRRVATSLGDDAALVRLLVNYGAYCYMRSAPVEAIATFDDALEIAERLGDLELRFVARFGLSNAQFWAGRLREGLATNEEALEMGRDNPRIGTSSFGFGLPWSYGFRGWILLDLGRLEEARKALEKSLALILAAEEKEPIAWATFGLAWVHAAAGEGDAALERARSAIEVAERLGSSISRVGAHCALGLAHLSLRCYAEAIDELEHTLALSAETGAGRMTEWRVLPALAEALTRAGELERAVATGERAVRRGRETGMRVLEADGLIALARARLAADPRCDLAAIESLIADAKELIARTGARRLEPLLHLARAELATSAGDGSTAERELHEAKRAFIEIGAPLRAAEVDVPTPNAEPRGEGTRP